MLSVCCNSHIKLWRNRKKSWKNNKNNNNNAIFEKTMENVREHWDIKLVTAERRRNCSVSEPNCHTTTYFTENLLAVEMKKTQILKNKPIYLALPILKLSKILMYEFWYDYVKPKYGEKAKLSYIDTDSFILYIKKWYL